MVKGARRTWRRAREPLCRPAERHSPPSGCVALQASPPQSDPGRRHLHAPGTGLWFCSAQVAGLFAVSRFVTAWRNPAALTVAIRARKDGKTLRKIWRGQGEHPGDPASLPGPLCERPVRADVLARSLANPLHGGICSCGLEFRVPASLPDAPRWVLLLTLLSLPAVRGLWARSTRVRPRESVHASPSARPA